MNAKLQVTQDIDRLIDLICDFNITLSIEKEDLVEIIKYQRKKIRFYKNFLGERIEED